MSLHKYVNFPCKENASNGTSHINSANIGNMLVFPCVWLYGAENG